MDLIGSVQPPPCGVGGGYNYCIQKKLRGEKRDSGNRTGFTQRGKNIHNNKKLKRT